MIFRGNARDWQLRFRLGAAIVMITYALGYYIYYVLGLFTVEWMESYQDLVSHLWPLFWIIPIVILTHVFLGLWKIYKRNTFKMPLWEKAQILLGVSIPFFLLPHIVYTYGAVLFFGVKETYIDELMTTYPQFAWQYIGMTLAVWLHAQIGAHVVLRMRKWYPKIKMLIIILFSLMPLIGITGYLKGGLELTGLIREKKEEAVLPSPAELDFMKKVSYSVYAIFPLLYVSVLAARAFRIHERNKNKNIRVRYTAGKEVSVFSGTTILEASRIGNIPHASICGGRGRCTTCRVKVENGMDHLSPVGDREMKALKRIDAKEDVRLACQAECRKDSITVTLLLPPDIKSVKARKENSLSVGKDMELVVMFVDLRGFTRLSEEKFPYDVVFILNNYFNNMGEVIEKNSGVIDKFLGDGILAYFGFKCSPEEACRQSITAAKQMAEKLLEINDQLKNAVKEPLEIGIGIHFGEVILGELGYKDNAALTIIGDTVNTASRIQSLNKKTESQLIFTKAVAEKTGFDFSNLKRYQAAVRGKKEPLDIYVVKNIVQDLTLS